MDITANNKHRFATKWMNTETVNYTAAYTLCLLVLFAVKQLCKVALVGGRCGCWDRCRCGCATVLCTGEEICLSPGYGNRSQTGRRLSLSLRRRFWVL